MVTPPEEDEIILLYKEPKRPEKWEEQMYSKYESKCVEPSEPRENGADYILCFSFWDINELVEIGPEPGAIYIYSSSEAFDEERGVRGIIIAKETDERLQYALGAMPDVNLYSYSVSFSLHKKM